ncbi:MAG: ribosomal protein S18-alanine N-acetyltransferase [Spirochaetes bacterium]|nr:ribosomal protein S18-alanine N-acetyltransferase [Spirochaetota bacterium]
MKLIIRKAAIEDIDAVYAIEREGQARWSRQQFAEELGLAFSRFVVVENGTGIIGFSVSWNVAGEIQLNNIGVRRERRRRGTGTLLMEEMVSSAREPGMQGKIYLEVSERNEAAVAFYLKNGFTATGRRKNYYDTIDAILMEREVRK